MELTRVAKKRELDVMSGIMRGAVEGKNVSFKKLSKLMRREGLIGYDEHVVAIEYYPFLSVNNVRVIVSRSRCNVSIDN